MFLLILVGGGSVILFDLYRRKAEAIEDRKEALDLELVEIEALLEERDLWLARDEWRRANQPVFESQEAADNQIFKEANAEGVSGVEVSGINLLEPVDSAYFEQAGVSMTATGTLEAVFEWIYNLQRPETFRVVRNIRVLPDPDDGRKVRCTLELLRWYAPADTSS